MHHGKLTPALARGLRVLGERIDRAGVPPSKLDETLTLATWNIREFGRRPRLKASLHYIAEILGQFDLVAVVELRDNIDELSEVLGYLGPYWDAIYSDYGTDAGGNRERIAFVFDRRAVTFTGLASNVQPHRVKTGDEYLPSESWWRPPYMVSFRAGNFDFVVLAAHIRWANPKARLTELRLLARWVSERLKKDVAFDRDMLVVGDFNIPSEKSELFAAITANGLKVPAELLGAHGTNLAKDKRYDQILHLPEFTKAFSGVGGVLDFYAGDHRPLYPGKRFGKREFTYELSDHLPLWVHVRTDNAEERLDQVIGERRRRA